MSVDLSIIIVTYNGRDITRRTLAAYTGAVSADAGHNYEIIVVDNASRDGVTDVVRQEFPQAQLIVNDDNLGFSKANNMGYQASQGRYLLFSNPDIEVTSETLPTLIQLMEGDPAVAAGTPFLRLAQTGQIDWGAHRGFPTPWAAFTYMSRLDRLFKNSPRLSSVFGQYHLLDQDLNLPHEVDVIRGGFFLVRRHAFAQVGCWDEDYFMFGEDIDLCYQLKTAGYKIMFYPQAQALHYHGMTTGLKEHSQDIAAVDLAAREKAYHAFYDTMKIFYTKNYQDRYSPLMKWLVFLGVEIRRRQGAQELSIR